MPNKRFVRVAPNSPIRCPASWNSDYTIVDTETLHAVSIKVPDDKKTYVNGARFVFTRIEQLEPLQESSWITARSIAEYRNRCFFPYAEEIEVNAQIAEVGCGLGALLEYLVEVKQGIGPKPIAIDPANFTAIRDLISHLFEVESGPVLLGVEDLQRRIDVLQDPTKVTFYNMDFQTFTRNHPNILQSIDVVVDLYGYTAYQNSVESYTNAVVTRSRVDTFRKFFREDTRVITHYD